jgi:NADH-quinone oxidoreductase subunit M
MLLTLAIFLPLAGAIVVLCIPERQKGLIRGISLLASIATMVPLVVLGIGYAKKSVPAADATLLQIANERVASIQDPALRLEVERLRGDATLRPSRLAELPSADRSNPAYANETKADELRRKGVYDVWHEVWELHYAKDAAITKEVRYVEYGTWIKTFNIHYFLGVDGLSLPLLLLTGLLGIICVYYSFNVDKAVKAYMALFLILETGLLGVFSSLDFFLFYVFWEIVLLPMYFLIGYWGGPRKLYAAIKFFIYTLLGSVVMLVAMLALYFKTGHNTFNLLTLIGVAQNGGFDLDFQKWIWIGLFAGFAIKVPIVPFHTWLPDAHVEAPTAISMMLAGVLLKMGGYGFFRFSYTLAPDYSHTKTIVLFVAILGLVNMVYGALCAMAQKDFKSLVAYSSISHMGYVLLGLAALTDAGIQGAALQMLNHGVSSAMMFLLVGVVYERAHHRNLDNFGGMGLQMPYYTGFATIGFFASLGLPGLNGFISEFLVFQGAFKSGESLTDAGFWTASSVVYGLPRWIVYAALPAIVLTAGYILWTIQRVYLGEPKQEKYKLFKDLDLRETLTLIPLAGLCIWMGVQPQVVLGYMDETLKTFQQFVTK